MVAAIYCAQKTGFDLEIFRSNHPQGTLGKRLERTPKCSVKIAS